MATLTHGDQPTTCNSNIEEQRAGREPRMFGDRSRRLTREHLGRERPGERHDAQGERRKRELR